MGGGPKIEACTRSVSTQQLQGTCASTLPMRCLKVVGALQRPEDITLKCHSPSLIGIAVFWQLHLPEVTAEVEGAEQAGSCHVIEGVVDAMPHCSTSSWH